jgi:hypothetical protein
MASISVYVELDNFDTDELLEEIADRYNYDKGQDKNEITTWLIDEFNFNPEETDN